MNKTIIFIMKLSFLTVILLSVLFIEESPSSNRAFASLTLLFSASFLYKCRNNLPIFLASFFMLYCNYSIVIGEYFVGGALGTPMNTVKTIENYGLTIRTLLIFASFIYLFYKSSPKTVDDFYIPVKNNVIIFYGLISVLCFILVFGVNRSDLQSYAVSITPMYEYSTILFLFSYYASGNLKSRYAVMIMLLIPFILQDFYYGGRITSLQLILLFLLTVLLKKISLKSILIGGGIGVLINSLVGAYRKNYSFETLNVFSVLGKVKDNFFVFDTPVFAYYASATHVAATEFLSINDRAKSFIAFITSIFTGSNELGNVTRYVSTNFYANYGGGLIPTHFYYWLGWSGVVLSAVVVIFMLNRIGTGTSDYWKLIAITVVFSTPRWYLYTPLSLFRPILLVTVLYILFVIAHKILIETAGVRKQMNIAIKNN